MVKDKYSLLVRVAEKHNHFITWLTLDSFTNHHHQRICNTDSKPAPYCDKTLSVGHHCTVHTLCCMCSTPHTNIVPCHVALSRALPLHDPRKVECVPLHVVQDSLAAHTTSLLQGGVAVTVVVSQHIVQQLKHCSGLEGEEIQYMYMYMYEDVQYMYMYVVPVSSAHCMHVDCGI